MAAAVRLGASLRQLITRSRGSLNTSGILALNSPKHNLLHTYAKDHKSYPVIASGQPRTTLPPLPRRSQATTITSMASTIPKIPSGCWYIKRDLEELKQEKWGWVIYRTDYTNNLAWSKFKDLLLRHTAHIVDQSDVPEVINSVEWVFMDDRAIFDQASTDFLRKHFDEWADAAVVTENPRAEKEGLNRRTSTRYCEFVMIDVDCLQTITGVPDGWDIEIGLPGYFRFVDSNWTPMGYEPGVDGGEVYEEIDGCQEENVGWMLVPADQLSPEFYTSIHGSWWTFYVRPPEYLEW